MGLNELVGMSNKYGSNTDYVIAGGGNTSYKDDSVIYVKSSGNTLSDITQDGFVALDRMKLSIIYDKEYSKSDDEREASALEDLMASRLVKDAIAGKRPSVETLLHNLFPFSYVLHIHPSLVNGLTCSFDGASICDELFGESAVWIDETKPGYKLAKECESALFDHKRFCGIDAQILFIQNHGVFFAADTCDEIDKLVESVFLKLKETVSNEPDIIESAETDYDSVFTLLPVVRMLYNPQLPSTVLFYSSPAAQEFLKDASSFAPLMRPFTPDHIVYCRAFPLFIERGSTDDETAFLLKKAFEAYAEDYGYKPKVIAVTGLGFFICNNSKKNADIVKSLLIDSIKIAYYAACFSHPRNMSDELCEFIIGWEAESYRAGLSEKGAHRLSGKVAIITGSAQGFGKGIAERLAAEGAYTVIADINYEGASICSQQINEKYKYAFALPVKVNVTDEKSVESMIKTTVMNFGGIDIFINNAGIVRAGSLDEMSFESFSLVTGINYSAYFLCAKYASKVMKRQYEFAPDYYTDIIEINSKSGLTGSNKNFAYAGSKFGGIGLTQSFALELVQYNIKVNAICPGNFFEGPLWSDPEKGLFIQYLKAGKVPGANSVEDVKKYYEEKIPMKRGCRPEDVVKAILYIIDQKYETGQALPVTGGQVMLN